MRDGWEHTTLGEVITLHYGKPLKADDRDGTGFPVYGSAGVVGYHSEPVVASSPLIVVGRKGTAGAVHWSDHPASPIDTTYWVECHSPDIDYRFLYLALQHAELPDLTAQTGVPGLNRNRVYEQNMAIPPFVAQRRIVDLIDLIDRQIVALHLQSERATRALAVCSQDLNGRTEDVSLRKLASVAEVVMGQSPRGKDCNRSGDGEPLLNGPTEFTDLLVSDPQQWTTDAKRHAQSGDVLLCVRGATAGRMNVARYPTAIGRGLAAIRGETQAHTNYIRHMLAANLSGLLDGASGTIFPNISSARLRDIVIPWPGDGQLERFSGAFEGMEVVAIRSRDARLKLADMRAQLLTSLLSGDHEIPESYDRFLKGQGAA